MPFGSRAAGAFAVQGAGCARGGAGGNAHCHAPRGRRIPWARRKRRFGSRAAGTFAGQSADDAPAAGPEATRIATRRHGCRISWIRKKCLLEVVRRVPSLVKAQATRLRRGRSQCALPCAVAAAVYRRFAENAVLEVVRRVLRWSRRRRRARGRAEATCARLSPRVARRATCRQGNRQPCAKIMNAHGCNRPAIRRGRRINYREGDGRQARRIFPCSG